MTSLLANGLFIHEIIHGIVPLPFVIIFWHKTHSLKKVFVLYLTAFFIDADHLLDFWSFYGINFNLGSFFNTNYFELSGKGLIPFHAWEWIIVLLWFASRRKKPWNTYYFAIALGMLAHLSWDGLAIKSFSYYSIFVRATNGFTLPS